jgi:hypothetical protein
LAHSAGGRVTNGKQGFPKDLQIFLCFRQIKACFCQAFPNFPLGVFGNFKGLRPGIFGGSGALPFPEFFGGALPQKQGWGASFRLVRQQYGQYSIFRKNGIQFGEFLPRLVAGAGAPNSFERPEASARNPTIDPKHAFALGREPEGMWQKRTIGTTRNGGGGSLIRRAAASRLGCFHDQPTRRRLPCQRDLVGAHRGGAQVASQLIRDKLRNRCCTRAAHARASALTKPLRRGGRSSFVRGTGVARDIR